MEYLAISNLLKDLMILFDYFICQIWKHLDISNLILLLMF